ncbi:MAG: mitomycin antibiotic biosynthesis protein [Myxococcales bacterium]|nr:MAG: mitomycin antibiotic biosynthesis protein [Myxococcales bacterium]
MTQRAQLARLSPGATADEIAAELDRAGGVIVEGVYGEDTLARIDGEIAPHLERADPGMRHLNPALNFFFGDKTRHVAGLASKSFTFASEVLCESTILGVCDLVLGPSCASYQLNVGHLLDRGPGAETQFLHRDEDVWIHLPRPHAEVEMASITALDDFTEEVGATLVVPGSHRWVRGREPEPHELAVAEMPRGSVVVYLGSTIHGAGANVTDRRRRGLHVSYVVGWLRTEENNDLATPPEVARKLPRRAQEILGYSVHDAIESAGGYLGAVDLRDPVELLAEGKLGGAGE